MERRLLADHRDRYPLRALRVPRVTGVGRRLARSLAGALLLTSLLAPAALAADPPAPTTGTAYAGPCQVVGSQDWWNKTGIVIPSAVGQHVHVDTCVPTGIVNGTVTLRVVVTQHNGTGPIRWIRACRESSNCQRWSLTLGPCADCSTTVYLPINVGAWPSGRQELRLTANVSSNSDGLRQFQSTAWPINVRATTPCDRCSVFWTARGWYDLGHDYANAGLLSPPASLGSGATIKIRLGPGAGGSATRLAGIYIDPDFHHGSAGIVVRQYATSITTYVALPALQAGPHRLVLLSSDGFNAGVLSVGFVVP